MLKINDICFIRNDVDIYQHEGLVPEFSKVLRFNRCKKGYYGYEPDVEPEEYEEIDPLIVFSEGFLVVDPDTKEKFVTVEDTNFEKLRLMFWNPIQISHYEETGEIRCFSVSIDDVYASYEMDKPKCDLTLSDVVAKEHGKMSLGK